MTEWRIITSQACLAEGVTYLCERDSRFVDIFNQTGMPPLRLRDDGFTALLNAIVSQQVSVASAAKIWQRIVDAGLQDPNLMQAATDETLRECGFSRPKMRYARALANANLDYVGFRSMPADAVISELTKVLGIGQWTAEIYVKFSLGHADVFAVGDLALQEAAKVMLGLDERPNEKEMSMIARQWMPWRSVAARLLWSYYRLLKNKEGIGT